MSYILDALKKAERERGKTQVPNLYTVHDADKKRSGRSRFLALAAFALLAAVAGLSLFWGSRSDHPVKDSRDYTGQQSGPGLAASVKNEHPRPETGISSRAPDQNGENRIGTSGDSPLRQSETPEPGPGIPSTSVPQNTAGASRIAGYEPSAAAIPPQDQRQGASTESPPPAPEENPLRISDLSSDNAGLSESRARSLDISDRKSTLQQAMEAMRISILLYAEAPSERLVFINGRKYVEGDFIDGRYLLETITPDGAVLNYEGAQAVLKPKAD